MTTSKNAEKARPGQKMSYLQEDPGHSGERCQGYFTMDGQALWTLSFKSPFDPGRFMEEVKRDQVILQPPKHVKMLWKPIPLMSEMAELMDIKGHTLYWE